MKSRILGVCAIAAAAMLASGIAHSAEPGASEPGAMQIVFVDGASLRLDPKDLAKLDGIAGGTDVTNGGPAVADGIVRLQSGRLRHSPVLLSGNSATANASLAIHAALRGDSTAARAALRRAQAESEGAAPGRGQSWASVARAHVLLAEAQVLDLDDRYREAEAVYHEGLEAIASDGTRSGLGDVQVLLAAELTRGLAENLDAQGRHAEAQAAARRSVRTYAARFGRAPAFAGGGQNGGTKGGSAKGDFTQVAVNWVPGGAVVSHMLLSGALFVTVIGGQDSEANVRDAVGRSRGGDRSTDASGGDNSREASGTSRGGDRSTDASGGDNTREASGTSRGGDRSTDGSGGDNTREASGTSRGGDRSTEGSDGDNTREASGKSRGGTPRS